MRNTYRVRATCQKCGKLNARSSRRGLYFTCKFCGHVNPGPALVQASLEERERPRAVKPKPQTLATETGPKPRSFWDLLAGR